MSTNIRVNKESQRSLSVPNNSPQPRPYAISLDRSGGAVQSDAAGTDINSIVAQYKKYGTLPNVARMNPLYGDYTFPEEIHEMREAVYEAEQRFNQLPADVRSLCDNDWVTFLDNFNDPEKREELFKAGLKLQEYPHQQPTKTDNNSDKTLSPSTDQQTSTDTPKTQAVGGSGGEPPIVRRDNKEQPT